MVINSSTSTFEYVLAPLVRLEQGYKTSFSTTVEWPANWQPFGLSRDKLSSGKLWVPERVFVNAEGFAFHKYYTYPQEGGYLHYAVQQEGTYLRALSDIPYREYLDYTGDDKHQFWWGSSARSSFTSSLPTTTQGLFEFYMNCAHRAVFNGSSFNAELIGIVFNGTVVRNKEDVKEFIQEFEMYKDENYQILIEKGANGFGLIKKEHVHIF